MHVEWLGEVNVYLATGLKVFTAIFLGGMIGLDRERKLKAAGIKTNVLICLGACLFTTVAILNSSMWNTGDPNRVIAQIVSGIGFLGAGAIIHGRGHVVGLTTAATIWTVAAVGVTIGSGFPFIATMFTSTVLVVLNVLGPISGYFDLRKIYYIEVLSAASVKKSVRQVLLSKCEEILDMNEAQSGIAGEYTLQIYITVNPRIMVDIQNELEDLIRVTKVYAHRASGEEIKELEDTIKQIKIKSEEKDKVA